MELISAHLNLSDVVFEFAGVDFLLKPMKGLISTFPETGVLSLHFIDFSRCPAGHFRKHKPSHDDRDRASASKAEWSLALVQVRGCEDKDRLTKIPS